MTPTTVTLKAMNRSFRTGFNDDLIFGRWATASMSLVHNGKPVATWHEMDVSRLLARLTTGFTSPLGERLALDLYPARVFHTSPEALNLLVPSDFYLSVASRETDESIHTEYVPLPVFRQAVAVARAEHAAWLSFQRRQPVPKPRQV